MNLPAVVIDDAALNGLPAEIFKAAGYKFYTGPAPLSKYLTPLIAQVLRCPNYILAVLVTVATLVGAQAVRSYDIDVWMAFFCGIIVFLMKRLDFNIPAFTMGMVLAALIEERFRRALLYTNGSASVFFTRPVCLILWVVVFWMVWRIIRGDKKSKKTE